ncbi:MAG: hypothetical protein JXC32_07840, partial [Anaerolineae bacterium]|nr:hypothetical protein [Anaerolineae bacterium]
MSGHASIEAALREIRGRIAEAALRAGRDPADIRLVAVTKTLPIDAMLEAYAAGQRDFGENRPEEGAAKIPKVMDRLHLEARQPGRDS